MNYSILFKKAYRIVMKNKFLWLFGFLVGTIGLGSGGGGGSGYNGNSNDSSQAFSQIGNFIAQYWLPILIVFLTLFIIYIIFSVLSIISKGALVSSITKINNNEETGIKDGFKVGWHNFWRILGIGLLLFLIIFVPILILIIFSIFIMIIPIIGWLIGILIFLLMIPIALIAALIIGVVGQMAYCYCVIDKKGILESLKLSWDLFKNRWKNLVVIFLLLWLIGIIASIVLLVIAVFLFLIGLPIYFGAGLTATIVYAIIVALLFIIFSAILSGAVNSYTYSVWVLAYLNLVKNIPLEEATI